MENRHKELSDRYRELNSEIIKEITYLMTGKGVIEVDFNVDYNGKRMGEDGCDEEWLADNRAYTNCYGKYCNYDGFVSKVEITNTGLTITSMTYEINEEFPHDFTDTSCGVMLDILGAIINYFEKIEQNESVHTAL